MHNPGYLTDILTQNPDGLMFNVIQNLFQKYNIQNPRQQHSKPEIKSDIYLQWITQRESEHIGKHHSTINSTPVSKPFHWSFPELTRKMQVAITRLRLGHAFTHHHKNKYFGSETFLCRLCGAQRETIEHLLDHCPVFYQERQQLELDLLQINPKFPIEHINWKLKLGTYKFSRKILGIITIYLKRTIHKLTLHNIHL